MSSPAPNVLLVSTDRKPFLSVTRQGVDLSIYVSIVLRVRRSDNVLFTLNAIIDDSAAGTFHFEWGSGNLQPGVHDGEIVFTDGDGLAETFPKSGPLKLVVRDRV